MKINNALNKAQYLLLVIILVLAGCSTSKETQSEGPAEIRVLTAPVIIQGNKAYRETPPKYFDLIHTKLKVSPDWEKRQLNGEATLALRPHFYPQDTLVLNAKYFDINQIELISATSGPTALKYRYDSLQLYIYLTQTYLRTDTLNIFIKYTAKPYEGSTEGSKAITSDRGLYFVNADGKEAGVPQQIWTQGETEASSRWFPTIDHPNQKTTQEIYITVDSAFTTLSNGVLQYSSLDSLGMRTDYWRLDKPHAPYLFMMAIGKFVQAKNLWRDSIEVNYYMEPAFAPYAQEIFGNTPEMLEFFSNILNYDFPWPKFSQVVVRDFVSGAMENTTAVVFFDKMNRNHRELLDEDHEDIISHELFHQWFGDLVTCESWSNIPLNESFATYGEVLWVEHKYGQAEADLQRYNDMKRYFTEAAFQKKKLIRFDYDFREEMFDRHSYQKGGLILHMLREEVGDEAFFQALNLYLRNRAFNTAEYHDLRLAFEEVTGRDMNPFFNQWFTSAGHPVLNIVHLYNDSLQRQELIISQLQDTSKYPVFKLPATIAIYSGANLITKDILIESLIDTFSFPLPSPADVVIFDSKDALLAQVSEEKAINQWYDQYFVADRFPGRLSALQNFMGEIEEGNGTANDSLMMLMRAALQDSFWYIRESAIREIRLSPITGLSQHFRKELLRMAQNDQKPSVRKEAIYTIGIWKDSSVQGTLSDALNDSSYSVVATALNALAGINASLALAKAKEFRNEENELVKTEVLRVISMYGNEEEWKWFRDRIKSASGEDQVPYMYWLAVLLERSSLATIETVLPLYKPAIPELTKTRHKVLMVNALTRLSDQLQKQYQALEDTLENTTDLTNRQEMTNKLQQINSIKNEINAIIAETSKVLLKP